MNKYETLLNVHLVELNMPYLAEAKLIEGRKFRWDFVIADLAIEINGSIWQKGGHNTGKGLKRDYEKARLATMAGYKPVTFTTDEVMDGTAIEWVKAYINREK